MRVANWFGGWLLILGLVAATKGFGQTNAPPEISARDATNYLDQDVVVTDKVVQAALRPTVGLLNLNQKFPNSPLTCVIRGDDTNNFPDLQSYVGKRVEITGHIVSYQGRAEIVLTSTNQIKILNGVPPKPKAATAAGPFTQTATPPAASAPQTNATVDAILWIAGSLGVIITLLAVLVFLFWQRNFSGATTPPTGALVKSSGDAAVNPASVEDWKQRALAAEAMAGKQGQMLREKIMPELTEFAKQSLVQGLYAQRSALIETQQKAQHALAELEARLNSLQLPLQERIRAYENRIAELEKEVESQGAEVRELTRATLALVRRKLEDERQLERAQNRFN